METPQLKTSLQLWNIQAAERLQVLTEFERKHHDFLVSQEPNYFLTGTGAIVFLADTREQVRAHFGSEHWMLQGTVLQKHVDGVVLKFVTDGTQVEEVEI